MKRIVLGVVVAICTFFVGIGLDRLFASAYSKVWPNIPVLAVAPDLTVYQVEFCELIQQPGEYDGKIVRVNVRRGMVNGTILGLLGANACSGFVRTECPADGTCDLVPNLIGHTENAKVDMEIIGKFRADDFWNDHVIEVRKVNEIKPLVDCADGSKAENVLECPAPVYKVIDLRINGVGISSSQDEVINALGQPRKRLRGRYHQGASEREITLKYDGLAVDMLYAPNREVVAFQVTSNKWDISGIRVGDDESVLRSRFGMALYGPIEDPDVNGGVVYGSENGIYVTFKIKNGKITEIWAAVATC